MLNANKLPATKTSKRRIGLLAVAGALSLIAIATPLKPAAADNDWRWRHHGWHDHDGGYGYNRSGVSFGVYSAPGYYYTPAPSYYYAPPPTYYAPAPTYYYPQPSVGFGITISGHH